MEKRIVPGDAEFWARARRHLLRYGGEFVDFVPVGPRVRFCTMGAAGVCWTSHRPKERASRGGACCSGWNSSPSIGTKGTRRALSDAVTDTALKLGLGAKIVRTGASDGITRIAPPLTATEEEIDLGLILLDASLEQTLEKLPRFRAAE